MDRNLNFCRQPANQRIVACNTRPCSHAASLRHSLNLRRNLSHELTLEIQVVPQNLQVLVCWFVPTVKWLVHAGEGRETWTQPVPRKLEPSGEPSHWVVLGDRRMRTELMIPECFLFSSDAGFRSLTLSLEIFPNFERLRTLDARALRMLSRSLLRGSILEWNSTNGISAAVGKIKKIPSYQQDTFRVP